MANRIQLRRDTTANWNSVDPVLADGEPGYDIVTNEIRIGDGSNTWSQLSANTISGGGGASTGNVTFSDINVIGTSSLRLQPNVALAESYIDIYLTSGPDAHIDTYSANLILGKDSSANVRLATDGNVQIRAQDGGSTSTWTFDPDGKLTFPNGTTIDDKQVNLIKGPAVNSFGSDSPTGVFTTLDYTGLDTTWIVNGPGVVNGTIQAVNPTDKYVILTRSIGSPQFQDGQSYTFTGPVVSVGSKLTVNNNDWTFGTDGTLTLPGDIKNGTAGLSFPSGGVYLTTNLDDDNNALYFDPTSHDAQLYVGGNITLSTAVVPGDSELDWKFGTDGKLAFPNNSAFDGQTLTDHATGANYTLKIANGGVAGSVFGIGTGSAAYGIANDALNHTQDGYVPYSVTASRINLTVLGAGSWVFDNTGNLTVPGNLISFASSPAPFISGFGSADFSGNVTVGNLILPAGGQIQSSAGTGNVTIEANDGNNAHTWTFTTAGNIHIPSVQYTDFVNIDATISNIQTIGQNAYIEFGTFSGEILVNDLTDGFMYKILVGSGKCAVIGSTNSVWTTAAPGVAVTIASYIKIEFTGGKYRFTNLAPSRDYNFYTIKTRNNS